MGEKYSEPPKYININRRQCLANYMPPREQDLMAKVFGKALCTTSEDYKPDKEKSEEE